jgi:hypothetical protein
MPTSSRIWRTVTSVVTAACSRKAFRSSTKMVQRSLIRLSTWPLIFFKRRFPADHMFTMTNEREDDDDVQNWMSWAYDRIKSLQQQTCHSISIRVCPCLDCGVTFFKGSASCVKSNASCMAFRRAWICSSRSTCVKNV